MNIKNKKYSGFSLAEVMIALLLVGLMFLLTALNMTGIIADSNTAKFKKAYAALESTIAHLLNHKSIYGTVNGFKETEAVMVAEVGEILGQNPLYKFRDSFKYHTNPIKDEIKCTIYNGASSAGCFQTDDGIVWGIPDTDFVKQNMIKIQDYDGDEVSALPITIYPDYKEGQKIATDAVVAAVTYSGKISMLKNIEGVTCNSKSKEIQCQIEKFVKATTIKIDDSQNQGN